MRRRVWTEVGVVARDGGFGVTLDNRPVRTPGRAALAVPTRALAAAIAAEWDAVTDRLDPRRMPLTRAANSAIDKVTPQRTEVADMLASYGGSDLICYRADSPDMLAARQAAAWDPWLDWARTALGAPLIASVGVMHVAQPERSLAALRDAVRARDAYQLTGLHDLVTLSGSLILGLAVADGALDSAAAWELSRVDEAWQQQQWGTDAEAEAVAEARWRDFHAAHNWLSLLG